MPRIDLAQREPTSVLVITGRHFEPVRLLSRNSGERLLGSWALMEELETEVHMYKHILVAIDESDTSDLALREAINLAKDQNAVLRLVHAVDLTPVYLTVETPYPYVEYQKAMEEGGEKILTSRAKIAREAGIEVESKLITIKMLGVRIYDVIEEQSKQWPADLIVMGTHGRSGFQHARLGSVAEGLIRLATKPVLLIRGQKA